VNTSIPWNVCFFDSFQHVFIHWIGAFKNNDSLEKMVAVAKIALCSALL
jgi:hypothetical protein